MSSLRPSAFNLQNREDGGPFLIIESNGPEGKSVNVYFTDIPSEKRQPDSPVELLLNVCPESLTIWPLNIRHDRKDYLRPKYGQLDKIMVARRKNSPYELPATTEEVEAILEELPDGFAKDFRFGLGLLWEYRSICETVADLEDVDTLWLHGGNDSKIEVPCFILGEKRFHALRKELNSITSRYQRDARRDKLFSTYQALLHGADASRFPAKKKKLRTDMLADLTHGGRDHATLSKRDQRAAVQLVQDSVETLVESAPKVLLALKSEIELVTLKQLIDRYQEMLGKGLSEGRWQSFFKENPFILSLAFAVPFILVQGQAYAGGKGIDGRGGKYTDFLWAAASTGNLALIEIKKPETDLLTLKPYRGVDVYGPSQELGGAIAQVLDQRFNLMGELPNIKSSMNRYDIHGFAVRSIVIAGTMPQAHQQRKSFELVRNALSDVMVVTFDELCTRLSEIHKALTPPTPDSTVPF